MKQIFLHLDSTRKYHLIQDTEKKYTFVLGALSLLDVTYLRQELDKHKDEAGISPLLIGYVRFGLKDVIGEGITFADAVEELDLGYFGKRKVVKLDFIQNLSQSATAELALEIAKDNDLLKDEVKNS